MTVASIIEQSVPTKPGRAPKQSGGADLGQGSSREAKRTAAAILEVLAGSRTPAQAATALQLSVPRYYQVEAQALRGLLQACEPRPRGRQPNSESTLTALRQDNQRLEHEVSRQQALVRAAQRAVGLAPPAPLPATKSGKKIRKRRVARALSVAKRLQHDNDKAATLPASASPTAV